MMSAITRFTLMAAACGFLLSTVNALTREDIRANREAFERRQLLEVAGSHRGELVELGKDFYALEADGKRQGFVFEASTNAGYNGEIELWLAVDTHNQVLGVRVKSHQETPGIGDKIELPVSDWITSFEGKSLGNPPASRWKVEKDGGDFDQFSGATVTPRAVVGAVKGGLRRAERHRDEWLAREKR